MTQVREEVTKWTDLGENIIWNGMSEVQIVGKFNLCLGMMVKPHASTVHVAHDCAETFKCPREAHKLSLAHVVWYTGSLLCVSLNYRSPIASGTFPPTNIASVDNVPVESLDGFDTSATARVLLNRLTFDSSRQLSSQIRAQQWSCAGHLTKFGTKVLGVQTVGVLR